MALAPFSDDAPAFDLRLTLTPAGTGKSLKDRTFDIQATLSRRPGEVGTISTGTFRIPVDRWEVEAALNSATTFSAPQAQRSFMKASPMQDSYGYDALDPIKDLGARLFRALFDGSLERRYRNALDDAARHEHRLRLRLIAHDPALMELPWEFLYDSERGDFMALSMRSPVLRQLAADPIAPSLRTDTPLRILVATADVNGQLGIDAELELIQKWASEAEGQLEVEIVRQVTRDGLYQVLSKSDPHVFHFCGTGVENTATGLGERQSLWLMGTGSGTGSGTGGRSSSLRGSELMKLLKGEQSLRLVYLSACHSDWVAAAAAQVAPAAMGFHGLVQVEACLAMTDRLYRGLVRRAPLETSLTDGRQSIDRSFPGSREWGMPQLYTAATDTVLLPERATTSPPTMVAPEPLEPTTDPQAWKKWHTMLTLEQRSLHRLEALRTDGGTTPPGLEDRIETTQSRIASLEAKLNDLS